MPKTEVARAFQCSVSTVSIISKGREPKPDAERCPGCGHKVLWFPCAWCRLLNDDEIKLEIEAANGHLIEFVKPKAKEGR